MKKLFFDKCEYELVHFRKYQYDLKERVLYLSI
jgi:hypothetical protein